MKQLLLHQLKSLKYHKIDIAILSLLIIAITMTFTAIKVSVDRLGENYESYLESQNLEDFYFSMGEINVDSLSGRTLWTLCEELSLEYECALTISKGDPVSYNNLNVIINNKIKENPTLYENLIDNYINQFANEYEFEYEKQYISSIIDNNKTYKFVSLTNKIDIPYIVDGKSPEKINEIAIFPEYAKYNNLSIGDTLTINNQDYLITGFFYKVDFLFPIMSLNTILYEPENQTLVLATKETMDNLNQNLYLKYIVDGDLDQIIPDFGYETLQSGDYSLLGREMSMISILLPSDINFRVISLRLELDNANAFLNSFLPTFLFITLVLTLLFLYRNVKKNKKTLYILNAIGYTKNELTLSMMVIPLFIASMSFIGYTFGLVLSKSLFNSYSERYLFPKAPFSITFSSFFLGAILPFITIIVISYLFTINTISKTINHKDVEKVYKYRSFITEALLFVILSFLLLFGFSGANIFDDFTSYTKKGNHYAEMINLRYITNDPVDSSYETYTRLSANITAINSIEIDNKQATTIYGIDPSTKLKILIDDNEQNNLLVTEGFIASQFLKDTLNLKIGDVITLKVNAVYIDQKVVGFSNELLENNLFTDKAVLNAALGLSNDYYNGVYTTDTLYESQNIVSRISYTKSIDDFSKILNVSSIIISYLVVLSVFISIIALYLMMLNFLRAKQKEIALLRVIGYYNKEIHLKYYLPIVIIAILCFLISIPITYKVLNIMLKNIMEEVGFRLIIIPSISNIIHAFVTLSLVFIATYFLFQAYYKQSSIAAILKRDESF